MKAPAIVISVGVVAVVVGGALILKSTRRAVTAENQPVVALAESPEPARVPQPLPRFVDVGTTTCAPCRVMLGVMDDLTQRYPGAMAVEFVNIAEQPAEAERLGVKIIPAQIFYAPDGRELYRHVGVFRTQEIAAKWSELGFPLPAAVAR